MARDPTTRSTFARAAAVLALVSLSGCGAGAYDERAGDRRNLILISVDTLRADRLGSYGYARPTSPNLDALAATGVRFDNVIAEANWTLPSHMTLFTGLPPSLHQVTLPVHRLRDGVPTLAEVLQRHGFRTVAATGLGFLDQRFGFARGFEHYSDAALDFSQAFNVTLRLIERIPPEQRFFAFVHAYDVHCPYEPPPFYAKAFQTEPRSSKVETRGRCGEPQFNAMHLGPEQGRYLSDRYDAGIRHFDALLAVFLDALRESGRLDRTVVCVLSDHGEEFLEHGRIGHRETLYLTALRVPWILAGPGIAPAVIRTPVGLADVMPTLLDVLGVEAPETAGRSLADAVARGAEPKVETLRWSENDWNRRLRSAVVGDHHVIAAGEGEPPHVYDWRRDPGEQTDLAGTDPARDASLLDVLERHERVLEARRGDAAPARIPRVAPEEAARLRELGYVE